MPDPAIHVTTGFTPTTWFSAAQFTLLLAAMGVAARFLIPWRKMSISAGERMREELSERLNVSEAKRAALENDVKILRHRLNNATHALDLIIALLEADPTKVEGAMRKIKGIREEQAKSEAIEKGLVMAAREAVGNP